jgi:hypothetical protein
MSLRNMQSVRLDAAHQPQGRVGSFLREVLLQDPNVRYDNNTVANPTLFLLRQLQYVRSEIRTIDYPEHKALQFLPLATDIPASVSQYVYFVRDRQGKSRIQNANAKSPMPRFDITTAERYGRVVSLEGCYGWTIDELREAARLNMDLPSLKAENARDILLRDTDEVLRTGQLTSQDAGAPAQTASTIGGFVNHAEVAVSGTALTFSNEAGVSTTTTFGAAFHDWFVAATTADQMIDDLANLEQTIISATLDTHRPDTLLLATALKNKLSTTKMSQASDKTVLQYYLANSQNIRNIDSWIYLDQAGVTDSGTGALANKHRLVMYQRDKRVLEAVNPIEYEQQAAQIEGFEFTIPCRAKVGGVKMYNPRAVMYADVSTKTA